MDWHGRDAVSFSSDIDQLSFEPRTSTVVDYSKHNGSEHVHYEAKELPDSALREWLKSDIPSGMKNWPAGGMRIVVSDRAGDPPVRPEDPGAATLAYLPFSRETFLELMDQFQLSRSFVRTVLRGDIHFSCSNEKGPPPSSQSLRCFNMRMANAWPRDLAMSASVNVETGMTYALFHGCDERDVKLLKEWLRLTTDSTGHPILLPALFAEMQMRRHKQLTKINWMTLVTQYAQTGQYGGNNKLQENALDYDKTTREILRMYQDTGYLEKSLQQFQRRLKKMRGHSADVAVDVPERRKEFYMKEGARLRGRLEDMIDEYEVLIAECKRVTDGATLLTGAIWNLIAQRDNVVNQSIATDYCKIAADARRDSSAMKTIAVLTMAFLPGTFVAAFFALPLFEWDAPAGASVVSDRFWIYWAVTIPLTASLFLLWTVWHLISSTKKAPEGMELKRKPRKPPFSTDILDSLWRRDRKSRANNKMGRMNHDMT